MKDLLLSGAMVVDPSTGKDGNFDILVKQGLIEAVEKAGSFGSVQDVEEIQLAGKHIFPGLIDVHTHLREPGFEWKETIESGCSAAVAGGFTTVSCMPNTNPVNDIPEVTEFIIEKAKAANKARVFPTGAVTKGLKGKEMAPLSDMYDAGCIAFSDDGEPVWDDAMMRRALEWTSMFNAPICGHEEVKSLTPGGCMNESGLSTRLGLAGMPRAAEDIMIGRDIELARLTGGHVHICHLSTARGAEMVRRAKADGIKVTAEVTPHHLFLTETAVEEYGTAAKMSPPLRLEEDRAGVLEALIDGSIDFIGSDHAPHELDSKQVEFSKASFGILGFQTTLPLTLQLVQKGELSLSKAVEVLSCAAARVFNLPYGTLKPGSAADLVVVDLEQEWTLKEQDVISLSKNTPFLGWEFKGAVELTLRDGQVVYKSE